MSTRHWIEIAVAALILVLVLSWWVYKRYSSVVRGGTMKRNIWLLIAAAVFLSGAGVVVYFGYPTGEETSLSLTAVALVSFAATVVLIAALVIVYQVLGLTDLKQALALPDGSVRALIAFTLVLVFVCLAAFLYNSVSSVDLSSATKVTKINKQSLDALKTAFIVIDEPAKDEKGIPLYEPQLDEKGVPRYQQKVDDKGNPQYELKKDEKGAQVPDTTKPVYDTTKPVNDTTKPLYNATYYPKHSKDANDFAKQIFTTLATVFVSVISFYFGSSTTASGVKAARNGGGDGDQKGDPQSALNAAKGSAHDAQVAAERAATAAQSADTLAAKAPDDKKSLALANAKKVKDQSDLASQAAKDANTQVETARKAAADAATAGTDTAKASAATADALKARDAAKTLADKAGQSADEAERLLQQIKSDTGAA